MEDHSGISITLTQHPTTPAQSTFGLILLLILLSGILVLKGRDRKKLAVTIGCGTGILGCLCWVYALTSYQTTTNSLGDWQIADVEPGHYRLEASASGYQNEVIHDVTIVDGMNTIDDITLIPLTTPTVPPLPMVNAWHIPTSYEACTYNASMRDALNPTDPADPVCIYIGVYPIGGASRVILYYRINEGNWQIHDLNWVCNDGSNDFWWTACDTGSAWYPDAGIGDTIEYFIQVEHPDHAVTYLHSEHSPNRTAEESFAQSDPYTFTYSTTWQAQLDESLIRWNTLYGTHVRMIDWELIGIIEDESHRTAIIGQMTDPNQVYIMSGDPMIPETVSAQLLQNMPPEMITEWNTLVNEVTTLGQTIIRINWEFIGTGHSFSTLTVAEDSAVILDSMLHSTVNITIPEKVCGSSMVIRWLWGGVRGAISWSMTCVTSPPPACSSACSAWMTLGDAQIMCIDESLTNSCKLNYGWGFAVTPGSVTISWDPNASIFNVVTSGFCSGRGQGNCVDPCPTLTPTPTNTPTSTPTPTNTPTPTISFTMTPNPTTTPVVTPIPTSTPWTPTPAPTITQTMTPNPTIPSVTVTANPT